MSTVKTAAKERPILFSEPMVRAILDGSKTQTRRIIKPQPERDDYCGFHPDRGHIFGTPPKVRIDGSMGEAPKRHISIKCPYGKSGDQFWVRETWNVFSFLRGDNSGVAKPLKPIPKEKAGLVLYKSQDNDHDHKGPWRPSIHMPRWASRIDLRVTGVRVERLQDISRDDAKAEGIEPLSYGWKHYGEPLKNVDMQGYLNPRNSFMSLWDSINGKESRLANPWVWVIEFERVSA